MSGRPEFPPLDRRRLGFSSLRERRNRVLIERDRVLPQDPPRAVPERTRGHIRAAADAIRRARSAGRPVILAFGAHAIKNGLAPVLAHLMEEGWLTHLATNGAGIIHDWEFAFQGASSEDVQANLREGRFGLWEETGRWLGLALLVGAYEGRGYGESVGALVHRDGLTVPSRDELLSCVARAGEEPLQAAAAADLLWAVEGFSLAPGFAAVQHPYKRYGLQAAAFRLGVPYTAHPMFGHDIIYAHPLVLGSAVGRTAERDFLGFAGSVCGLDGGVYLSVGSAVMSPMILEKALSMARNLALQEGRRIEGFSLFVVDLSPETWDWQADGEPPEDHPAYYVRYLKSFSRMDARLQYIQADNRDFFLYLCRDLGEA
ncbi:MAG: hypothetical protein JW820_00365 [Spirochaetales bacterium]|nr:hypothetical protein [Spirochaetales bacterium]